MLRPISLVALWLAVLSGAFVSVREVDFVQWPLYAMTLVVGIVAVFGLRITARRDLARGERVVRDHETMRSSLQRLSAELDRMVVQREEIGVYEVHGHIDEVLVPDLAAFVDVRETLIHSHGLDTYARVMTAFATAERLINRAWSASADGYIDEVWTSMQRARDDMQQALESLPSS